MGRDWTLRVKWESLKLDFHCEFDIFMSKNTCLAQDSQDLRPIYLCYADKVHGKHGRAPLFYWFGG